MAAAEHRAHTHAAAAAAAALVAQEFIVYDSVYHTPGDNTLGFGFYDPSWGCGIHHTAVDKVGGGLGF